MREAGYLVRASVFCGRSLFCLVIFGKDVDCVF